jgi:hypothetical protein
VKFKEIEKCLFDLKSISVLFRRNVEKNGCEIHATADILKTIDRLCQKEKENLIK